MTYEQFESKLIPGSVIVTEIDIHLIIIQIIGDMVILHNTSLPHEEPIGLRKTGIYNNINQVNMNWRLLTKEEYVEVYI